jgi:hypothetical protein
MNKDAARRRENEFLSCAGDAAAVYRLDADEPIDLFEPLEQARLAGKSPIANGYDLISTGPIMQGVDALTILDEYRATGFAKSGDVVAFKQAGVVTCWYVDHLAYSKLPGLLNNHLAAAEMSVEGNYNQIDGIINNMAPLESEKEALYLVGGTAYLHIQTSEDEREYTRDDCFTTYDYTLYDKETMRQLDSGRMEIAADIRDTDQQIHRLAAQNILECRTFLGASSIELVSMDILETLWRAAAAIVNHEVPKPSLLDNLRQCREEAGKSKGGTVPPSRDPER